MRFLQGAAVAALCLSGASNAINVTILADTNRDGKVDTTSNSDSVGKQKWTEEVGAYFLANIGDTNRRCSSKITDSTTDNELTKCNDAEGNVLRNPKYLAPLRTLPLRKLSGSATGRISISGKGAAKNVRIFHKKGSDWVYAMDKYTFTAKDLKDGLTLGIDARDVRRPKGWDGQVQVNFNVQDGSQNGTDSVAMRVAPVLTHHHLQLAQEVVTSNLTYHYKPQARFVSTLQKEVVAAGIKTPLRKLSTDDIWAQDFFEPGYTSMPGPNGPVVLRVMIRSAQGDRSAGRLAFSNLRSATTGAVQHLGGESTINSMGNLETIPPHTHNNKKYPAGRAIMGRQLGETPHIIDFLKAQEAQDPVLIDNSWLIVGHTDESMQFLRAANPRGWVLMAADPLAGLKILQDAKAAGHGKVKAMSRPADASDPDQSCKYNITIEEVLKLEKFAEMQKYAANGVQKNIDTLKAEVGITDADIIRVPAMYYESPFACAGNGKQASVASGASLHAQPRPLSIIEAASPNQAIQRRQTSNPMLSAYYPGGINSIVLSNTEILAPRQWGPVIDGRDILAAAVSKAYERVNYTVKYMDDWYSHHVGDGEVHCGSNVLRETSAAWW